jgi:hypothetical protein
MPRRITHKDKDGIRRSPEDQDFIRQMAVTGDPIQSAQKAKLKTPVVSARKKAERLAEDIEKEVRAELGSTASQALKNLIGLAFSAESEQVRAKCTMDLLDRAGFKPVDKHQEIKPQRSLKEIDAEIRELVGEQVADMLLGKHPVKEESPKQRAALKKDAALANSNSSLLN